MLKILSMTFAIIWFLLLTPFLVSAEQTYHVKKGDNLYKIAKKFKVSSERIQEANTLDSADLKPGMKLIIPSREPQGKKTTKKTGNHESSRSNESTKVNVPSQRTAAPDTSLPSRETQYHTVKKGDTLASLSKKYSISIEDLKELNNIKKSGRLKPGRHLVVKRTGPKTYTVQKGDTLWQIAKKFNISEEELEDINELESEDLKPGKKLFLETWAEQPDGKHSTTMISEEKISAEITTLSDSSELRSAGMKDRLILFARKMLNIPYRFGGSTFMGIDCSGYVQKVFGFLNMPLPRTAREQFHLGDPVNKENLSMGDLVFFRTYASFPSHVGIYLGNNLFIHASSRSRKVSIDSLDTPYYIKRFIGAKRLFREDAEEKGEYLE
jgi:peptidoglycan endopeptidase LytE